MLKTLRSALLMLVCVGSAAVFAEDYHDGGLAFGKGALTSQSSKTKAEPTAPPGWDSSKNGAWDSVKFSNPNPPQASSYTGGNLFNMGSGRINNCKTATPTTDRVANQDCDAVNFLAKNPTTRKKFTISGTDPILGAFENTMKNAKDSLDPAKCVKKMVEDPAIHETEFCNEWMESYPFVCDPTRVVEVDADSMFACKKTLSDYEEFTCQRAQDINVGMVPGCTPGQFLVQVTKDVCGGCIDYLVYDFVCTATGYSMHFYTKLKSNGSVYLNTAPVNVPGAVGANIGKTLGPNSHSGGSCYYTYYAQSCSGTSCSITTWFENDCQRTSYAGSNTFAAPTVPALLGITTTSTCGDLEERSK